jgi:phage baseplate assembly protein gpV
MDVWTSDDTGKEVSDGTTWRYNRASHIGFFSFMDGTHIKYDAGLHVAEAFYLDGADFKYDAGAHALSVALPAGATFSLTLNGATISVDASGNVTIQAAGDIKLITGTYNDSVNNIISKYNAHQHSGVQTGSGNTGAPLVPLV